MPKNLILFHMESVDKLHFLWNRELFPNIWSFAEKCINIKYHYSNSTSTFMTMNDVLYGENWYRFEGTISYDNKVDWLDGESESLLGYFESKGYSTGIITYPKDANQFNISDVVWKAGGQKLCNSREEFLSEIERFVNADRFAIYIWDATSHLNVQEERKNKYETGAKRVENGCKIIDESFGNVVKILKDLGRMDDTVIILFGDHGDDYWFHGFEDGYAHGTLPYTNIILTPLLIYDGETSKGDDSEHIISDCDIANMCKSLVVGESGESVVGKNAREYVFSRNLFIAQQGNRYGFNLSKGFSVSNKKYILLLNDHGYEMYYVNLDPQNSFNILDYFKLLRGNLSIFSLYLIMRKHTMIHEHFLHLINEAEIDDIKENFDRLKKCLSKELGDIYKKGIKGGDKKQYLTASVISYRTNRFWGIYKLFFRIALGRIKRRIFGKA